MHEGEERARVHDKVHGCSISARVSCRYLAYHNACCADIELFIMPVCTKLKIQKFDLASPECYIVVLPICALVSVHIRTNVHQNHCMYVRMRKVAVAG